MLLDVLGLEMPPVLRMAKELREAGHMVPTVTTAEQLVDALWP